MDADRYIEVIGLATIERKIELYRMELSITVRHKRWKPVAGEATELRERVLKVLTDAGVRPENVEEAGGLVKRTRWERSSTHNLLIGDSDIRVLARALAQVQPLFSEKRYEFSSQFSEPVFSKVKDRSADALKEAVDNAKRRAEALAQGAGLRLGEVLRILELPPKASSWPSRSDGEMHDLGGGDILAEYTVGELEYTPTKPPDAKVAVRCVVRFRAFSVSGNAAD